METGMKMLKRMRNRRGAMNCSNDAPGKKGSLEFVHLASMMKAFKDRLMKQG